MTINWNSDFVEGSAVEPERYWDDTNPIFLIDFYKFGHVDQYPKGIKKIWVNFTPRSTRVEGETGVIFFGLQRFIKRILIQQFEDYFFSRDWADVEKEYKEVMKATLGVDARVDHIKSCTSTATCRWIFTLFRKAHTSRWAYRRW